MSAQAPPDPPNGNVSTFRVSTRAFAKRERLTAWREIFGRTVCNLDIDPVTADRFSSEATGWRLPGLGLLTGATSACGSRMRGN